MSLVLPTAPTGYSAFWVNYSGNSAPYNFKYARSGHEGNLAREFATRGFRKTRAIMRAMNGVAPGASSVDSYKRIASSQAMNDAQLMGGKRTIETINNAVTTTAALQAAVNSKIYDAVFAANVYPVDRSNNGGGGKVGR